MITEKKVTPIDWILAIQKKFGSNKEDARDIDWAAMGTHWAKHFLTVPGEQFIRHDKEEVASFRCAYALQKKGKFQSAIKKFKQILMKCKSVETIRQYLKCVQALNNNSKILKEKELELATKGWFYGVRDKYNKIRQSWSIDEKVSVADLSLMIGNHHYENNNCQHSELSLIYMFGTRLLFDFDIKNANWFLPIYCSTSL